MEVFLKQMLSYWPRVIRQEIFFNYLIQRKYRSKQNPLHWV